MSVENQNTIFEINIVFMKSTGKLYLRDWKSQLRSQIPCGTLKNMFSYEMKIRIFVRSPTPVLKNESFLYEIKRYILKMKTLLEKSKVLVFTKSGSG